MRGRQRRLVQGCERLEPRLALASYVVTSTADSGPGTLRDALDRANATTELDDISFSLAHNSGPIQLDSTLVIREPVHLIGFSLAGAPGRYVQLDGQQSTFAGIVIEAPDSVIRGLTLTNFAGHAIAVRAPRTTIDGNWIGVDLNEVAAGNREGVLIESAENVLRDNVIVNSQWAGVWMQGSQVTDNLLVGNHIGVLEDGRTPQGNGSGIFIGDLAARNQIGHRDQGGNVVSGNLRNGIDIIRAHDNRVDRNFIGADSSGTLAVSNGGDGVFVASGSTDNHIGTRGANVISGNGGAGVRLTNDDTRDNVVRQNYIGMSLLGLTPLGNDGVGVLIDGSHQSTVSDNVVSGNSGNGIYLLAGTSRNIIANNLIGVNATGLSAAPNLAGINITGTSHRNQVIGNIIAGNTEYNIGVADAHYNQILHNSIGRGESVQIINGQSTELGSRLGIDIDYGSTYNEIRGNTIAHHEGAGIFLGSLSGNVIAENEVFDNEEGIIIWSNPQNSVLDNHIHRNRKHGIAVLGSETQVLRNHIHHNGAAGVYVDNVVLVASGAGNTIRMNSIYANGGLGIELDGDSYGRGNGVNPNDAGDTDEAGPDGRNENNGQNYPELRHVISGKTTKIAGQLSSTPNTTFTIDAYASSSVDPSGHGEGQHWLGSLTVRTNRHGLVDFRASFRKETVATDFITLTATAPDGSTSEFSRAMKDNRVAEAMILGKTAVYLNGLADEIRREETNLGNLLADANLWYAKSIDSQVVFSLRPGAGVAGSIGRIDPVTEKRTRPEGNPDIPKAPGDISEGDIETTLANNERLTLLTINLFGLKNALEHSVSNASSPSDSFLQVGGLRFSYDPSRPVGERVQTVVAVDNNGNATDLLFENGLPQGDLNRTFRIVTLRSLADGAAGFTLPPAGRIDLDANGPTGAVAFASFGAEQDALAEYLLARYKTVPYAFEDSPASQDTRIQNLTLRRDSTIPDVFLVQRTLFVRGTPGRDVIHVQSTRSGNLEVTRSSRSLGVFRRNDIDLIHIQAYDGSDTVWISPALTINAYVAGGRGNDTLFGGNGNNILLGESGNDTLHGGMARNVMIGGAGQDTLYGGFGEDVLIGGETDYDASDAALLDILGVWSANLDYATRVATLGSTSHPRRVNPSTTYADSERDTLFGRAGFDLFVVGVEDTIDQGDSEFIFISTRRRP